MAKSVVQGSTRFAQLIEWSYKLPLVLARSGGSRCSKSYVKHEPFDSYRNRYKTGSRRQLVRIWVETVNTNRQSNEVF